MNLKEEYCKITGIFIGLEDHLIPTIMLQVSGLDGSWSQGFGGYDLSTGEKMVQFIRKLLDTFNELDTRKLVGKIAVVKVENGIIRELRSPETNKCFNPAKDIDWK